MSDDGLLDIALEKGREAKALLDALEAQADFGEDAFADVKYDLCWLHDELTTEIRSLTAQLRAAKAEGEAEYMLRVPGEPPSGAVRTTREEILEDKKYVEARWGKREAVQRTIGPWTEVAA